MIRKGKEIIREFSSLFYPNCCPVCDTRLTTNEEVICLGCLHKMPRTNNFIEPGNIEETRIAGRFPFVRIATYSIFSQSGVLQPLIHDLKYNGKKEIGVFLGKLFGKDIAGSDFINVIDYIVPVPLHPKKEKQRGFNQAEMIALGISHSTNTPVSTNNLIRDIYNPTQTKLSGAQRWKNVKGIFKVIDPEALYGKHVLIVDDIITTGSTLEACADALSVCKDIRISVATIGQVL